MATAGLGTTSPFAALQQIRQLSEALGTCAVSAFEGCGYANANYWVFTTDWPKVSAQDRLRHGACVQPRTGPGRTCGSRPIELAVEIGRTARFRRQRTEPHSPWLAQPAYRGTMTQAVMWTA